MPAHTSNFRRSALAFSLVALLCTAGGASASTVASSTASLSQLTLRLVDLTPDDGIAPSATFSSSNLLMIEREYLVQGQTLVPFSGMPFTPESLSIGGSTASFTLDGLSATAQTLSTNIEIKLRADQTVDDTRTIIYGSEHNDTSQAVVGFEDAEIDPNNMSSFLLGAHSGLIIEGRARVDLLLSPQGLADLRAGVLAQSPLTPDQTLSYIGYSSHAFAAAGARLLFTGDEIESEEDPRAFSLTGYLGDLDPDTAFSQETDFRLELYNAGGEARQALMILAAFGNTDATAAAVLTMPVAPAIPEPSTSLLMGLGLAGVGLARRRLLS